MQQLFLENATLSMQLQTAERTAEDRRQEILQLRLDLEPWILYVLLLPVTRSTSFDLLLLAGCE